MYNKRKIGNSYEEIAINYLKKNGYDILQRNFFCKSGEIDIIAYEEGYLIFIEVKYRRNINNGYPEDAITITKQKRIIKTAKYYLLKNGISEAEQIRFDVVTILGEHVKILKDAFWAEG